MTILVNGTAVPGVPAGQWFTTLLPRQGTPSIALPDPVLSEHVAALLGHVCKARGASDRLAPSLTSKRLRLTLIGGAVEATRLASLVAAGDRPGTLQWCRAYLGRTLGDDRHAAVGAWDALRRLSILAATPDRPDPVGGDPRPALPGYDGGLLTHAAGGRSAPIPTRSREG